MPNNRYTDGPKKREIQDKARNPMFMTMEIKETEYLRPDSRFPVLTEDAVDEGQEFVIENKL